MMINTILTLDLRPESGVPLHRQVYAQIRSAILTGRVRSHQKLPSSRQLAQSLGISRTTVTESYDQLVSEGYLETRRGAGTFISAQIPDELLSTQQTGKSQAVTASITKESAAPEIALSAYGQRLAQSVSLPSPTSDRLSFHYWQPDLSLFPIRRWQRLVNRHASASTDWMTYSAEPRGYGPLRKAIATYITQARAVQCEPEQILITQGTQQSLGLIAKVLVDPGDAIALEDPGYLSARKIFDSYGGVIVPVPVDDEGLVVSQLYSLGAQSARSAQQPAKQPVKLAYVTPSHQFPTGVLMSLNRRLKLLEWARRTGGLIVEDDYDSEFRYGGRPVPALQGLDTHERVLYVGTFSKVMFPGLRLGYMVLPSSLVPVFRQAKWIGDRQCTLLHQAALTDFIASGELTQHIRRMRTVYEKRRQHLIHSLQSLVQSAGTAEIVGDPAGLYFMARLSLHTRPLSTKSLSMEPLSMDPLSIEPLLMESLSTEPLSTSELVEQAQLKGVSLSSTQPYYYAPRQPLTECELKHERKHEFIFGFGGLDEAAIDDAIARLRPLFWS